jgi:hypothetical protein
MLALLSGLADARAEELVDRERGFKIEVPEGFEKLDREGWTLFLRGPEEGAVGCAIAVEPWKGAVPVWARGASPGGFVSFCADARSRIDAFAASFGGDPPVVRLERDRGRRLVAVGILVAEAEQAALHAFYHPRLRVTLGAWIRDGASEEAIKTLQKATKSFALLDDREAPADPPAEPWPLADLRSPVGGGYSLCVPSTWTAELDADGFIAKGPFGFLMRAVRLAPGEGEPAGFEAPEGVAHPFVTVIRGGSTIAVVGTCGADTQDLWKPTLSAVAESIRAPAGEK